MVRSSKKRDSIASGHGTASGKKKKANCMLDDNPLCKLLSNHGFVFAADKDKPNELSIDQALFQQKLDAALKKGGEKMITSIMDGLEELWSDNYRFCFSLLPTITSDDCWNSSRGKQQDSLVRLLLGVEMLQSSAISVVLEKLPDISMNSELTTIAVALGDLDLVHRLVSQLRWQSKIVNSKDLIKKVLEIISISDTPVQKELISCIPDFIDDVDHSDIAVQLSQLLMENSHLVSSLLDALNNLNLKGDILNQMRDSVLKILGSADIADLPLVVKFLQQSLTDANNAFDVVSTVREKLDFKSIVIPRYSSTQHAQQRNNSAVDKLKSDEIMIFDVIKTGLRFQKLLADSWIKVIESIHEANEHKIVDVFVLLVLHNMKSRRKAIDTLLRSKVKAGVFTEEIITAAFNSYPQIFNSHISEILLLGEVLLRSPEFVISNYGCNVYKAAFSSFDLYSQQEVVGALVTHIGSGYGPEVETAFSTLENLVNFQTSKMASFTIFLKGILDYIDNLSVSQIRTLFSMISKLSFSTDESSTSVFSDDMYVVIRKQLSSVSLKYKRIGIIGSMMIIKNIAAVRYEVDFQKTSPKTLPGGNNSSQRELPDAVYKHVVEILSMVKASVKGKPEPSSIFYDELANIMEGGDIDKKVMNWVQETVVSEFQDEYLIDADVVKGSTDPQVALVYDLDEPEEGGISVNILPLLLAHVQTASKEAGSSSALPNTKNKLICLPALFRLVRICEQKQNKGDMEGIDALLGCPLVLFGEEALKEFPMMKEQDRLVICSSLFYAINWFREVLNGFCGEKVDADTRAKIIYRIKTLNTLNASLEKCLAATPVFEVPVADYSVDEKLLADVKPLKKILESGKPAKKPKKSKAKRKKDGKEAKDKDATTSATVCVEEETEEVEENSSDKEEGEDVEGKESFSESLVSLSMFPASLRQLDIQVFYALSYGSVSKKYMDVDMHTEGKEEVKLDAVEMNFLLRDLIRKLEHSLSGESRRSCLKQSAIKLIGFSHLPSDVEFLNFVIKLLPSLWKQLTTCMQYFQKVSDSCDGVVEVLRTDETKECVKLYQLLLQCLLSLLQWDGFRHKKNNHILQSLLRSILKDGMEKQISSSTTFVSLVRETFHCLVVSEKVVPSIHIAVVLMKILNTLSQWYEGKENLQEAMKEMLLKFLKHAWMDINGEKEKGSKFNESLSWLIRKCISMSPNAFTAIDEFCQGPVAELRECTTSNEEGTSTFPSMTKSSFTSLYKSLFEELIAYTKSECSEGIEARDVAHQLNLMHTSLKLFQTLNSVVKEMDSRANLMTSLKFSRSYLEIFLRSVMPLLDKTFRSHKSIVHSILKIAQQSTRSLQHLCGHSKFSKDVSMTTYVPALKKCLETFVFRVKAMLAYNNCDSAFWLGNLKNRDLQGNEILSQVSTTQSSDDDDEDSGSVQPDQEMVEDEDDGENVENSGSF